MKSFVLVILSAFSMLICSQNYTYPKDVRISDSKGNVREYGTYYFPKNMFIDTVKQLMIKDLRKIKQKRFTPIPKDSCIFYDTTYTRVDTTELKWFSKFLFSSSEPILCNYPLGVEMYRFTWLRSFDPGIVIRLVKDKKDIYMICKKISGFRPDNIYEVDKTGQVIKIWKNEPKLETDTIIKIRREVFSEFEKLIIKKEFNKIPNKQYAGIVCDGSHWTLEMHKPNFYWMVTRWSPNNYKNIEFREICDYLIEHSIFKNEKKY